MHRTVSLAGLRAFVEMGRRSSVREAAAALNVTPGAISQSLRSLENRFGRILAIRRQHGIDLTADGERLLALLKDPFEAIDAALSRFAPPGRSSVELRVSTTPSFAAAWLAPRIEAFGARYPGLRIGIEASAALCDLREGQADIAIRHGGGKYAGLRSRRLFSPRLVCVCGRRSMRHVSSDPAAWRSPTLLRGRDGDAWSRWFETFGSPVRPILGPAFENDLLAIQAAIAGNGLALVRDIYAERDIASGRLLRVGTGSLETDMAYFVVYAPKNPKISAIQRFVDWLFDARSVSEP